MSQQQGPDTPRRAQKEDIEPIARLWFDGWQDAHSHILPQELARHRTLMSFRERAGEALDTTFAVGPPGAPSAFYMLKGGELYQFYVGAEARGTGLAAMLIADAEARLRQAGVTTAWLACGIGNDRAARFYEKSGWRRAATFTSKLDTPDGIFELDVWRYEKALGAKA